MGGYGHSRAREWMIGGATRNTLTISEFPILMAH
jgi:nucleotide-binding universal stress UspA family protein